MEAMLLAILKEPLGLPIHALWEYGILAVLGLATVSFDWESFPKGIFGRVMHGSVRLTVFFALWAVVYVLLASLQWVAANLLLVCGIVTLVFVAMLMVSAARIYLL